MKKIKAGKLSLSTETLQPLQSDALDHVAGGASVSGLTPQITRITISVACPPPTLLCTGTPQAGGQ